MLFVTTIQLRKNCYDEHEWNILNKVQVRSGFNVKLSPVLEISLVGASGALTGSTSWLTPLTVWPTSFLFSILWYVTLVQRKTLYAANGRAQVAVTGVSYGLLVLIS